MWHQRYSSSLQEFHQKLRLMPLVNAVKNFIRVFSSVKIFRGSSENDKYVLARNLFCTAANKNMPAKQNLTSST